MQFGTMDMEDAYRNNVSGDAKHHPPSHHHDNKHNAQNKSLEDDMDEEHGCDQYEMTSPLLGSSNDGGGRGGGGSAIIQHDANGNTMKKHNRISSTTTKASLSSATAAIDHGGADHHHHDKNTTLSATSSSSNHAKLLHDCTSKTDIRSQTLYLKTAFWLTAWYSTSLATLFLNKIILSRPNSSVHVLGMCQMTTAAVLGGWSTYGGLDYMTRKGRGLYDCLMEVYRCRIGRGGGTTSSVTKNRGADNIDGSLLTNSSKSNTSMLPSKSKSNNNTVAASVVCGNVGGAGNLGGAGGISFHFALDMSIVGILRGVTVLLGLVALEHVPVSFVETIKATAPAFTVLFARLILQERTAPTVMLTLVPVVGGLILCSASELRFDTIGFVAAVMNNCADCVQNVMSKRMLAHMKPTQLQFYTSVAALVLQTPLILRDVSGLVGNWAQHSTDEDIAMHAEERHLDTTEDDGEFMPSSYYHQNEWSLTKLLIVDAIFYHLQSVSAYCTMGCMNPVSQSVANTLKRALLVWASILYFGNPVTSSGIVGILMVVAGVFLYNHVRRIHQS